MPAGVDPDARHSQLVGGCNRNRVDWAVLLVTGLVSFGRDTRFEKDHPFTSIPEFPSANESDAEALRNAATTFLESTDLE
jgi:hypothetical protein